MATRLTLPVEHRAAVAISAVSVQLEMGLADFLDLIASKASQHESEAA